MTDCDAPANLIQVSLCEDLIDQPEACVAEQHLSVGGDDAGRLLPAMLKRVEPQMRLVDRVLMPPNPHESAMMSNGRFRHGFGRSSQCRFSRPMAVRVAWWQPPVFLRGRDRLVPMLAARPLRY